VDVSRPYLGVTTIGPHTPSHGRAPKRKERIRYRLWSRYKRFEAFDGPIKKRFKAFCNIVFETFMLMQLFRNHSLLFKFPLEPPTYLPCCLLYIKTILLVVTSEELKNDATLKSKHRIGWSNKAWAQELS